MGNRLPRCEKQCMYCASHCAKAGLHTGDSEEFTNESLTCTPGDSQGAVFEETLQDLNDMDRQLLLFSAGSNLAAVRWLFILGADRHSCDSNGTTALHTSCRTGGLSIVLELLRQGIPLDASDVFGWTPLHIGIFMGRRDVALCLLRAQAPVDARNQRGQTPLDVCSDAWTREAILSFVAHAQTNPHEPWLFEREDEARQDFFYTGRLHYEPFFVPRSPAISECQHKQNLYAVGQLIFNKRPGQGLAFLVASGCTRDYPVDLSYFLRRGRLDHSQIGHFLGEAFSLSQTLRLEFINSVKFHGTSVVSSLAKVFTLLQIPADLQKIDRLVHTVARIWWRQHDRISDEQVNGTLPEDSASADADSLGAAGRTASEGGAHGNATEVELESFELKQYLTSAETLYQLMFSVVMLHWNLYAPPVGDGDDEDGKITLPMWLDINRGLEADGSDVPTNVLARTYSVIRDGFIPQLAIRKPAKPSGSGKDDVKRSLMSNAATVESWACIVGHPWGAFSGAGPQCTQIPSIFSETLASVRGDLNFGPICNPVTPVTAPGGGGISAGGKPPATGGGGGRVIGPVSCLDTQGLPGKDRVWLSLCYTMLFLAPSPSIQEAPYAFVHLRRVVLDRAEPRASTLTLVCNPEGTGLEDKVPTEGSEAGPPEAVKQTEAGGTSSYASSRAVVVIFLLPDGRWQEVGVPRLEVQLPDEEMTERWVKHLRSVCGEVDCPSRHRNSKGHKASDPAALR